MSTTDRLLNAKDFDEFKSIITIDYYRLAMDLIEKDMRNRLELIADRVYPDTEMLVLAVEKDLFGYITNLGDDINWDLVLEKALMCYDDRTARIVIQDHNYYYYDVLLKAIRTNNKELFVLILYAICEFLGYSDKHAVEEFRFLASGYKEAIPDDLNKILDTWKKYLISDTDKYWKVRQTKIRKYAKDHIEVDYDLIFVSDSD